MSQLSQIIFSLIHINIYIIHYKVYKYFFITHFLYERDNNIIISLNIHTNT
jgi:hypothetical protein